MDAYRRDWDYNRNAWEQDERANGYVACGCVSFVGIILTLILIPMSFSKVEYYEGRHRTRHFD